MNNISAIILTKGYKDIKDLKKSLSFCKEIIVVKNEHITDFAEERNKALTKARNEWVLFIDDDESFSKGFVSEILNLKPEAQNVDGYYVRRRIYFLGKPVGEDVVLRLAKKKSGKWVRAVHEIWNVKNGKGTLKNFIIHNTADNLNEYILRMNIYSDIHAVENLKEGKKSGLFKIVVYPQLKFIQNILMGRGMIFSLMQALHSSLAWTKLWQLTRPKGGAKK